MKKPITDPTYLSILGHGPKQIPHWEHWSNPDAETYLSGVDYYEAPRQCREILQQRYPQLGLPIPTSNDPKPRPKLDLVGESSDQEKHTVRWGDGESWTWDHNSVQVKTTEDVFAFSPLQVADFTHIPVVESQDYSSEEIIYQRYLTNGQNSHPGEDLNELVLSVGFYNTMFMWPLLTFGWELFMQSSLDPRFERVMDEFAEINRRVFGAFARLPIKYVVCHDDIVMTRGPVCSPKWMHKYIFPRYEEFWAMLKAGGKEVIFMTDGCIDQYVDDVMACGAVGFCTEPYTNFKAIARRYKDVFIAGEGDNRVLSRNNPEEIRKMVESMVETGRMSAGYMMCVGNHIPWNVPPDAIKRYLDLSSELATR